MSDIEFEFSGDEEEITFETARRFKMRFGQYAGKNLGILVRKAKTRAYLRYLLTWTELKEETRLNINAVLLGYQEASEAHQKQTPAEKPEKPVSVDDSLEIATISLPPYLYNVSQASINFLDHKRYRMVDIKNLENRIKSLEYYTSLSLLETNTSNLFIPDSSGLNRFKSGFFVDNFTSFLAKKHTASLK